MDAGQNPRRFVSVGMERSSAIRLLVIVMVFPCLISTCAEDATLALMHTRVLRGRAMLPVVPIIQKITPM